MKLKVRSLTISFLVMALLIVVLGGYLHFHAESQSNSGNQFLNAEAVLASIVSETSNSQSDIDPCVDGFCHIGHCSHLLVPETVVKTFQMSFPQVFFSRMSWPNQVHIDGPFQPPRFV